MGIRRRILLSFLALFVGVLAAAAALSTILIANAVDHRLSVQTQNLAALIDRMPRASGFEENLRRLMTLHGAESLKVGTVSVGLTEGRAAGERVYRATTKVGELEIAYSPEVMSREKAEAVRPFLVMAAAGGILVVVLASITAGTIARPLERLAEQTKALPSGEVKRVGGGAELDHLVEAMNRMLAEVRRSERLGVMGQMAAGVAHEIRNPLSSIKMTVQMLREGAKDAEAYDLVLREIERLELIAAELTGASQPLRKETVKLDTVVDDVLELMRRRLEHLGVQVERSFAPAKEVPVDVARFKRCVMNLVLNGAQAMPAGGPLRVAVGPRNGKVRFSVTAAG
ncbi:MAG TPA: histidine kinase dimerization/phospho-acceptor domain-containing protein, partial [Planctomycetota bacterium]|nr:histidine kinase dimerization/phospho-acceptor domain-containing protein [Planctomycetota bacterium]